MSRRQRRQHRVEDLTALAVPGQPALSPDGDRCLYVLRTTDTEADRDDHSIWLVGARSGPRQLTRGRADTAPIVIDRLDYQADGAGLLRTVRLHLHMLDVTTADTRQVTSGNWHAGTPSWSPDSTRLAFSAATTPDADLTLVTPVHVREIGAEPEVVGLANGYAGPAVWTADGTALLVVGAPGIQIGHMGLWRIPLDARPSVNLAESLDRNVMPGGPGYPGALPQLSDDGETVYFCVRARPGRADHRRAAGTEAGRPSREQR
ncbi:TolB family protein [Actinosynnema sp. ALI-1.44]|uniref:TolB family protein n=1 Tax=Actinosynnema sp. ALI-1.44 TaxID=1933779 RepID=UPI000A062785|nr:PD40 domain-containing protein [Actinosynnema sp. ALI-1.44]